MSKLEKILIRAFFYISLLIESVQYFLWLVHH
jgi:hypothetical protein